MSNVHHVSDDELGALLHRLIVVEGEPEVEIVHPLEGNVVVTRENYAQMMKTLERAKAMSPAERIMESKKIERRMQMRFRTMMIDAEVYTVDVEDDANFGRDIHGREMPIAGKIFAKIDQYPEGTKLLEKEIGCFVDENLRDLPVRVLAK